MKFNLANLDLSLREKINVDLYSSSIAFRERYNIQYSIEEIEKLQPIHLKNYFKKRIIFYRKISNKHFL